MNPTAPSPSDSSIAQAFRDYQAKWPGDADTGMAGWIERRARDIDASAPAAAVGGDYSDWLLRLAKEIHSGSERRDAKQWGHESERVRARFLRYAEAADCTVRCQVRREQAATPAAPVGGFVVDALDGLSPGGTVDSEDLPGMWEKSDFIGGKEYQDNFSAAVSRAAAEYQRVAVSAGLTFTPDADIDAIHLLAMAAALNEARR